jgi:hypothetical protein
LRNYNNYYTHGSRERERGRSFKRQLNGCRENDLTPWFLDEDNGIKKLLQPSSKLPAMRKW